MSSAFGSTADFTGMDGTGGMFIGSVLHKTFVDVAEKGTEAAAATANAAAADQAAAARSAADASAAAAQQAKTAATQAQSSAAQTNSPQQKLKELQSLYDQKLISASDYEAAKKKILSQLTQ